MIPELRENDYLIRCIDGAQGMLQLPEQSVKLVYGSPPYPNAERDYGAWHAAEYIDKMTPFIEAARKVLRPDGFLVINVKANREKASAKVSSKRSLVVEKLAILLEEKWGLHCVDIEIWVNEANKVMYYLEKDGTTLVFESEIAACRYLGVKKCSVSSCRIKGYKCKGYAIKCAKMDLEDEQ
mgnify:CR=1 FL=1